MAFLIPCLAFLLLFFLLPLTYVMYLSVGGDALTLENYQQIAERPLYLRVLLNTLNISVVSTAATLLFAYPIAYHLAGQRPRRRAMLIILVLLPFWTSILVKSFAFTVILGENGILNMVVRDGIGIDHGLRLLFNRPGVIIGMTHFLMPFMVFAILASLVTQNAELRRAAEIMGASRMRIFWAITMPLSLPGVMAGTLLCLILSMGMFVTPALLGGRGDQMISNLVAFHVRETLNWGIASALAVSLLVVTGFITLLLGRVRGNQIFGAT